MIAKYFETIKCFDYEVFNLNYHKKRISNTIGLNINLEEYIYPPNEQLLKCKVIYSDIGIIDIEYSAYNKKNIKSFELVYNDDIQYSKKSINRICIDNIKNNSKEDDIIIVKNNLITDTSIANIAIFLDNQWITPNTPLLIGTTRNRYIENNLLVTKDITVKMLQESKKIALLNAMIDFDIIEKYTIKDKHDK